MKSIKITLLTIITLFTISVFAQTPSEKAEEKPYIEIIGTAEKEIMPNEIYIAINIRERYKGKDKITIEKQELDLKEALKVIGIDLENLYLNDANSSYIKVKWSKNDVITDKKFVLKIENAVTVGKVFEKLDELDIKGAYIQKVSHSEIEKFKKEVKIMAIKASKEKADYLLEAIGERTGKPIVINETAPSYMGVHPIANVVAGSSFYESDRQKAEESVIQFQKIKLEASIYVKFEIE